MFAFLQFLIGRNSDWILPLYFFRFDFFFALQTTHFLELTMSVRTSSEISTERSTGLNRCAGQPMCPHKSNCSTRVSKNKPTDVHLWRRSKGSSGLARQRPVDTNKGLHLSRGTHAGLGWCPDTPPKFSPAPSVFPRHEGGGACWRAPSGSSATDHFPGKRRSSLQMLDSRKAPPSNNASFRVERIHWEDTGASQPTLEPLSMWWGAFEPPQHILK